MRPSDFSKTPASLQRWWHFLANIHPSVLKIFLFLVVPFSLIPPMTLLYIAGNHESASLISKVNIHWQETAIIFFIAELCTVPLMGSLIKILAANNKIQVAFEKAFMLAAITAIPMWVSSLGLVMTDLWLVLGTGIGGLLISARLLYRGMYVILKTEDQFQAQSLSYQVFSIGAIVWAVLSAFIMLRTLS